MGDLMWCNEMRDSFLRDIFNLDRNDSKFDDWDAYHCGVWG